MTNRDRLLRMSLYDLIMSTNCHRGCRLATFTDELLTELCSKHDHECDKCVNDWLNREAQQPHKI